MCWVTVHLKWICQNIITNQDPLNELEDNWLTQLAPSQQLVEDVEASLICILSHYSSLQSQTLQKTRNTGSDTTVVPFQVDLKHKRKNGYGLVSTGTLESISQPIAKSNRQMDRQVGERKETGRQTDIQKAGRQTRRQADQQANRQIGFYFCASSTFVFCVQ